MITPFYKILYKHDIDEKEIQGFFDELKMLDDELSKRATTFLGGNIPGMVDYMIWPWFERLGLISELSNDKLIINFEKYNKIVRKIHI